MRRILLLAAGLTVVVSLAGCSAENTAPMPIKTAVAASRVATKQQVVSVMQGFATTAFNRMEKEEQKCNTVYGDKQATLTSAQKNTEEQCFTDAMNVDTEAKQALTKWRAMKIPASMTSRVTSIEKLLAKFTLTPILAGCGNNALPTIEKASCYKPYDDQFFVNAANVQVQIEDNWKALGVNDTVL